MTARNFFSAKEKAKIRKAISEAELNTSGEIRVHIENRCKDDVMDKAAVLFEKLNMHKTKLRNGVLFYLAIKDKKFAILGDKGINAEVPDDFWDEIKTLLTEKFKEEKFAEGFAEAIVIAGNQLKKHFPYQTDDINELSDEISFGEK